MIKFMKLRVPTIILSIALILIGAWFLTGFDLNLGPLTPKGLNLGIDFQGGLVQQVTVYSGIEPDEIRKFANQSGLGSEIQEVKIDEKKRIGKQKSYLIKTIITKEEQKTISNDSTLTPAKFLQQRVVKFYGLIEEKHGKTYILEGAELDTVKDIYKSKITGEDLTQRTESKRVLNNVVKESENVISPGHSVELSRDSALMILFVLLAMLLYITFKFKFKYAVGAVAALVHDVMIIFCFLSVTYMEFDFTIIAAILFIIGYSLNDTIVIFDRIRENYSIMTEHSSKIIINTSINQSLSRTIITSLTTFLAVVALLIWGGQKINRFAITLIVGIVSGTYSSIFIASPVVDSWDRFFADKKTRLKEQKKEEKMLAREQQAADALEGGATEQVVEENVQLSKKQMKKINELKGKKTKK